MSWTEEDIYIGLIPGDLSTLEKEHPRWLIEPNSSEGPLSGVN
jgi:hypothetical protein